ncbi:hypothetical protein [Paraburkholderia sp. J41]|uniref:hypothetical protein n=1 Tax=Paraburkholderia sp. J41 TaxID=2805433 RepID=UPI002AC36DCF|nr:hypothetical protein [Paraburkholderia sp. J41]
MTDTVGAGMPTAAAVVVVATRFVAGPVAVAGTVASEPTSALIAFDDPLMVTEVLFGPATVVPEGTR